MPFAVPGAQPEMEENNLILSCSTRAFYPIRKEFISFNALVIVVLAFDICFSSKCNWKL